LSYRILLVSGQRLGELSLCATSHWFAHSTTCLVLPSLADGTARRLPFMTVATGFTFCNLACRYSVVACGNVLARLLIRAVLEGGGGARRADAIAGGRASSADVGARPTASELAAS
jgi:hypothetical protein